MQDVVKSSIEIAHRFAKLHFMCGKELWSWDLPFSYGKQATLSALDSPIVPCFKHLIDLSTWLIYHWWQSKAKHTGIKHERNIKGLRSIYVSANDPVSSLFYVQVIFHCVYVLHLPYPFVCRRTFRLFPCSNYCKECVESVT